MKIAFFNVRNNLCAECSLALRRFVGGMNGVESIDVEQGKIAVRFDEKIVDQDRISTIMKDSIEKLGYHLDE
ncbi:MAG TPA: heavy metal-associated domain-containing protein [Nitrospirota bacterium]|nr:heavy metal-associated domain-containing protein [Nitrospirota bacterium]